MLFRHSRGPINHLGLLSSRITTALGVDGAYLSDSREHSMESMTYEMMEPLFEPKLESAMVDTGPTETA